MRENQEGREVNATMVRPRFKNNSSGHLRGKPREYPRSEYNPRNSCFVGLLRNRSFYLGRSTDVNNALISNAALKFPNHCTRPRTFPHLPVTLANISRWTDYAICARTNPTTFPGAGNTR